MHTSFRTAVAALGVIPLTLALAGCFGGPTPPDPADGAGPDGPPDEELVEDMIEGSGADVDFEAGGLPADFPEADVPLVPGEVQSGMSVAGGQAWIVVVLAADEATADSAGSLLEAAGYSDESVFAWENDAYLVVVVGTQQTDDGRVAVQYQVQRK